MSDDKAQDLLPDDSSGHQMAVDPATRLQAARYLGLDPPMTPEAVLEQAARRLGPLVSRPNHSPPATNELAAWAVALGHANRCGFWQEESVSEVAEPFRVRSDGGVDEVLEHAWSHFSHARPPERLVIATAARQELERRGMLPAQDEQQRFLCRFVEHDGANAFISWFADPAPTVPGLRDSCLEALAGIKRQKPGLSRAAQLALGLVCFLAIMAIMAWAEFKPRKSNPGIAPNRLPNPPIINVQQVILAMVDQTPYELTAMDLLALLRQSAVDNNPSMTGLKETVLEMRQRRWLYREQHMVECCLANNGGRVPEGEIALDDDRGWETHSPAEAREIYDALVQPGPQREQAIARIRADGGGLNPKFWNSAVLDLTREEVALVLEGDLSATLELDRRLYPEPAAFELIRRVREQNQKLERVPGKAFGHHR